MAELKLIKNGAKPKRRNGKTIATKKVSNGKRKSGRRTKRNGVLATTKTKRNGARVTRTKRNGTIRKVSNGFFGDSKETVTSVISLLAGLGVTKVESAMLSPVAAQALGMIGLQNFARPLVEAGAAVTVNRWAAEAIKKGSGKFVMYGGLAMALMSLVEQFVPQTSTYNPFASSNVTPIVLNQPQIVDAKALASGGKLSSVRPRVGVNYRRPSFTY